MGDSRPGAGRRVSDYEYELPRGRIARYPCGRRDESRLLVVPAEGRSFRHLRFRNMVDLLRAGDVLVVNESRVLPARLLGRKPTGAPSEVLLLRPWIGEAQGEARTAGASEVDRASASTHLWEALVRPGGKLKPGRTVVVSPELRVAILDSLPGGARLVRLDTPLPLGEALDRYGHVPLPPYLDREDEVSDRRRYQTVYARAPGSVAAPTAGLHFTRELLDRIAAAGVAVAPLTLHVGPGTFRPVDEDDPDRHHMHEELFAVPAATASAIEDARASGGRVWAVGTTVVRTLESVALADGRIREAKGSTDLFIRLPFDFRVVDGLITNFHLPRSTLLMLVTAFGGFHRTMAAYEEAVARRYRFYSYGDAMALLRPRAGGAATGA